jgi:hypothetical protein
MKSILRLSTMALALASAVTLGAHTVQAQTDAPAEARPANAAAPGVKKGMTWGVYPIDPTTGTITVSCQGAPASPNLPSGSCDAYNGDTPGTMRLPVLCFNRLGQPYPVSNSLPNSQPAYWSGGVIATTPAVSPIAMGWTGAPRSQVDAYCASQFGPGWQVAEFHMGQNQGWKFGAYGNVGKPGKQRFWVHINDQVNANVWATP